MALSRPTLQQIVDRISSDFVTKITGATFLAMRSILRGMAIAYAGAVHLLYGYIDNQSKQLFARTATADSDGGKLDTIGSELGIVRMAAAAAVGSAACTGTPATLIPAGTVLVSTSNNQYSTNADATLDGTGNIAVNFTAIEAGAVSNDNAGITLSFLSPIAGVNSTAVVSAAGITGGTDEETDDAYRQRIINRKQLAPHGGNANDLVQWALEVSGVTRAWPYPGYNGVGTVALYFVCDGQLPITPTPTQIASVLSYLTQHTDDIGQTVGVPVTMLPGLFILAPTLVTINFTIKLSPNDATTQTQVLAELADILYREGYPGNTIALSRISEAISAAANEQKNVIVSPVADVAIAYNQVAVLGTVSFQAY